MSDYISRDELLELYPFDPDCEGCSVPYPIVRQNILDMPAADVIKRTAAVGAVLGLTITDERIVPYANAVLHNLQAIPKAEVAPVVHCKDCENLMFSDCYGECSKGYLSIVNPDDYCSRGVRRKEGDNQCLNTFLSRG